MTWASKEKAQLYARENLKNAFMVFVELQQEEEALCSTSSKASWAATTAAPATQLPIVIGGGNRRLHFIINPNFL